MRDARSTVDDPLSVSALERIDALCGRFEDAWQAGQRPRIADYLGEAAGPEQHRLLRELIALDIDYRRQLGEKPEARDYREWLSSLDEHWLERLVGASRYELAGEIGRGGMGAVLQGYDRHLRRDLAVKMLRPEHRDQPYLVRRFLREAWIGASLQHPGIVPVYELGEFPDRQPYFTMKLVRGRTLEALLKERAEPAAELSRFLTIFEQVCETVAYAHAQGILHRDLKPANIMVGAFSEVQVMDWGLAKVLDWARRAGDLPRAGREAGTDGSLGASTNPGVETYPGHPLGTYAYMPPEQARGEVDRLDERSDVFGLGAILCEILIGAPPFGEADKGALLAQVKACDHAHALARLDGCGADDELLRLTKACLRAERDDRPRNAGVVAEEVKAYRAGVQARLRGAELTAAQAVVRAEEEGKTARQERRARRLTVAFAAAVLLLLAAGGWGYLSVHLHQLDVQHRAGPLVEQARQFRDEKNWPAALHAGKEAKAILTGSSGNAAVRRQVDELLADVQGVLHLEENRLRQPAFQKEHFDAEKTRRDFGQIFAELDIDVFALDPEEAASRIRARTVRVELVAALEDWAMLERARQPIDSEEWKRLLRLARLADPDPWRDALRDAVLRLDRAVLEKLAADPDVLQQPASNLDRLGIYLYHARVPRVAVDLLERARNRYGDDFWINQTLAFLLHFKTMPPRLDDAIRYYAVARSQRPDSAAAIENLAIALQERGSAKDVEEAIALHGKALEIEPNLADIHVNLSSALAKKGRLDEAVAAARKAIELDPRLAIAHVNLAHALNEKKQSPQAAEAARTAIELDAKLALAHGNLGEALLHQGKLADSIRASRQAVDLKPDYGEAWGNLGSAYLRQKNLDQALAAVRKALDIFRTLHPSPRDLAIAYTNLGSVLSLKGQPDGALDAYQEAIRVWPELAEAHYGLGNVLLEEERLDEAIEAYQKALKYKEDYAQARWNLTLTQKLQRFRQAVDGKPDPALLAAQKAVRANPKDALARLQLGNALMARGVAEQAIKAYQSVVRLQPRLNLGYLHLALAYKQGGGRRQAIATLRQAIAANPGDANAYTVLGTFLREFRDDKEAIKALKEAIRLNPNHGAAQAELGSIYLAKGDPRSALPHMQQAVQLNGKDAELLRKLSSAYQGSGDTAKALDTLEKAARINPTAESHAGLAFLRLLRNDLDGALADCDRAIVLNRNLSGAHQIRGKVLLRRGAVDESIAAYRRALDLQRRNPEALFDLGCALALKGALDDAVRELRQALDQKADYPEARYILGNVLVSQGKFAEALDELERGHKEGSLRPGWIYPSAQSLSDCRRFLELDERLPAILSGKAKPTDDAEYSWFARLCKLKSLNAASVRLYEEAFQRDPKLANDLGGKHRYYAAGAAALGGCGVTRDDPPPTAQVRAQLRRRCLDWLRADLALWSELLTTGQPRQRALVAERMRQWQRNPDLAGLRDKDAVDKLPQTERDACRKLWADVADLLRRAQEK